MKNHIGIAEKLNRESILRSGGALLRSRPNCRKPALSRNPSLNFSPPRRLSLS